MPRASMSWLPKSPKARRRLWLIASLSANLGVLFIFLGFLVSIEVFSDIRLPFTRIVLARREPEVPAPDQRKGEAATS